MNYSLQAWQLCWGWRLSCPYFQFCPCFPFSKRRAPPFISLPKDSSFWAAVSFKNHKTWHDLQPPRSFRPTPGSLRPVSQWILFRREPRVKDASKYTGINQPCVSFGHLIWPLNVDSKITRCLIAPLNLVHEFACVSNQGSICLEMFPFLPFALNQIAK